MFSKIYTYLFSTTKKTAELLSAENFSKISIRFSYCYQINFIILSFERYST